MIYKVEFAADSLRDFELIFDHLCDSYIALGETPQAALEHAANRVRAIQSQGSRLGSAPMRGESHDDLMPGLRHLTLDRAIYWFTVDQTAQRVRVLAVFFGGQDHRRKMLVRLLSRS